MNWRLRRERILARRDTTSARSFYTTGDTESHRGIPLCTSDVYVPQSDQGRGFRSQRCFFNSARRFLSKGPASLAAMFCLT